MMKHGPFCSITKPAEIVAGSERFSGNRQGVSLMSQPLLSTRSKELARAGIVERRDDSGTRELPLTEDRGATGHRQSYDRRSAAYAPTGWIDPNFIFPVRALSSP